MIQVLKGKHAKQFNDKADKAELNKHTIDFSRQMDITKQILNKAKLI